MSFNMLIAVTSVFLAACLPVASSLSSECSAVRTPCNRQHIKDQQANMDPCVTGQKYFNCLATALNNAENSRLCDKLSLYTYRYDALREARTYAQNCQAYNFVIPASFQQPACQQEMAVCGSHVLRAFAANNSNDAQTKCSELDGFEDCMEDNTPNCAPSSVQAFVQTEKTSFHYQDTCIPSLSEECSKVRTPCNRQQTEAQQQFRPPCETGEKYIRCLANAFLLAERQGICDELALNTYRRDALSEAGIYVDNCPDFPAIPSTLQLDTCQTEMAACGSFALKVFVANNNKDDPTKCRELDQLKSCMETSTASCTDRQKINEILQKDLIYYEYQSSCLDTTTTSTTTTTTTTTRRPPTQKPTPKPTQKPDVTSTTKASTAKTTTTPTPTPPTPPTTTTTTTTTTTILATNPTTKSTTKSTTTLSTTPTETTITTTTPTTTTITTPISTTTTTPTPPTTTSTTTAAKRTTTRSSTPSTIPSTGSNGSGGNGPVVIGGNDRGAGKRSDPFTLLTMGLALIVCILRL